MNACSLFSFDAGQCLGGTIFSWVGPFWSAIVFWGSIALAVIVLLVVLSIFARLRTAFGWPGVIAGAFVFTNAISAALAFAYRGKIDAGRLKPHPTTGVPQVTLPGVKKPITVKKPTALKPVAPQFPFPFPPFGKEPS